MAAPQEQFSQGNSPLHRLDPRVKFAGAVLLTFAVAIAGSPFGAGAGLTLAVLLLSIARLPLGAVLRRLLVVNGFTAFLWVMLPLTYGSEPAASVFGLSFSASGCRLAWLITLKTNAILLMSMALLTTSTVPALGQAMRWWKLPEKLCLILLFSYRYLFVIHAEYMRLRRAAAMRCFVPSTSMSTYRTYGNLIGMTLVRSYNRAQRVGQAMTLRCFQGRFHSLEPARAALPDLAWGCVLCFLAITLLFLDA